MLDVSEISVTPTDVRTAAVRALCRGTLSLAVSQPVSVKKKGKIGISLAAGGNESGGNESGTYLGQAEHIAGFPFLPPSLPPSPLPRIPSPAPRPLLAPFFSSSALTCAVAMRQIDLILPSMRKDSHPRDRRVRSPDGRRTFSLRVRRKWIPDDRLE